MTLEAVQARILRHLYDDYFKFPVGTRAVAIVQLPRLLGANPRVSHQACQDAILRLIETGLLAHPRAGGPYIMLGQAGIARCERQRRDRRPIRVG
jgi:hypothetical protein